jgi:glutamate N-acetyltransferase / amino-acid N-acetyltransferase
VRPLPAPASTLPQPLPEARLPRGFQAVARSAGIKKAGGLDLGIIVTTEAPAAIAATFTTNRLPAAPVVLDREHLAATDPAGCGRRGWARAMMATSGCANAATGTAGMADQRALAACLAGAIGTDPVQVLTMSTGLIGSRLPVDRVSAAIEAAVPAGLGNADAAFAAIAEALRTTDSRAKAAAATVRLPAPDGSPVTVTISGVAKGVGMIHPDMATMLCFLLTDATVEPAVLEGLLRPVVARTWDQLSVDGDQSTNDTVLLAASGAAGAASLGPGTPAAEDFARALEAVARSLARQQAADGEGATTLITCSVSGAADDVEARAVARAVIGSSLVKAAVHGADPNWGRIAAAAGNAVVASAQVLEAAGMPADVARQRAGQAVPLEADRLRIDVQGVPVFAATPLAFDEADLSSRMRGPEVLIRLDLGSGQGSGEAFGCDLTEAYVTENSEYST